MEQRPNHSNYNLYTLLQLWGNHYWCEWLLIISIFLSLYLRHTVGFGQLPSQSYLRRYRWHYSKATKRSSAIYLRVVEWCNHRFNRWPFGRFVWGYCYRCQRMYRYRILLPVSKQHRYFSGQQLSGLRRYQWRYNTVYLRRNATIQLCLE